MVSMKPIFRVPKEFVAFRPFRYLRNPMSLGVPILVLELGLYESSTSILRLALALSLFLHLVVFYVEEPGLERRFWGLMVANIWCPQILSSRKLFNHLRDCGT
jgi:hypothetical protein